MALYLCELCPEHGDEPNTPILEREVEAAGYLAALTRVHQENPGHAVVSWGLKADILDLRQKLQLGT